MAPATPGQPERGARTLVAAAAATIVLAATALRLLRPDAGPPPTAEPAPPARPSVAVLGFQNLSRRPELAWISTALAEMLTARLSEGETLLTIPAEQVARVRADLGPALGEVVEREVLQRLGRELGARVVVLGSYGGGGRGEPLHLAARAQDTATGRTLAEVALSGSDSELGDLVVRTTAGLRTALRLGDLRDDERGGLPANREAARRQAEGLELLRAFDPAAARERFEQSIAADPGFALAHSGLAEAWAALGYDQRAAEAAKLAFDLSQGLPRKRRLLVEGRYREAVRDWPAAVEIHRSLASSSPDDLDAGLRLGSVLTDAGRAREALAVLEALRRQAAGDPRLDLAEARAAEAASDFARAQAAASRAAQGAAARGARLLLARARHQEALASWRLGEPERTAAAFGKAQRMCRELGDRAGEARALTLLGELAREHGDLPAARAAYHDALAIAREVGDRFVAGWALHSLGITHASSGDLGAATAIYEQAMAVKREIGDERGVGVVLGSLADALLQQGEATRARRTAEQALAVCRSVGDGENAAWALSYVGRARLQQGDLAGARQAHEEALAAWAAMGHESGRSYSLHHLGEILLLQDDAAGAQGRYQEALGVRTQRRLSAAAERTRLGLAQVLLETGQAAAAEAAARQAAAEFQRQQRQADESWARVVLARALLASGRRPEAQEALARAEALIGQGGRLELHIRILATRLEAGLEAPGLAELVERAGRVGLVPLDGWLALARHGGSAARLAEVEREAARRGFALLARQAHALRRAAR